MPAICQRVPSADRIASDLIGYIDCEARSLSVDGYAVLAASGSSASLALTALLTIFIALFGYRMLFGDRTDGRDLVIGIVKIGIVLAFSTSWAAYQPVVYDLIWSGPAQLAAEVGRSSVGEAGLSLRLDNVDRGFRVLALYGVGGPTIGTVGGALPAEPAPFAGFDAFALGFSRMIFLVAAVGGFGIVRTAAGLLLALGPIFLGFLLFDGTRGLFFGWLKALIGSALAALALIIALRLSVSLLEPWLADLVSRRASGQSVATMSVPLLSVTTILALIIAGLMLIVGRLGSSWTQQLVTVVREREALQTVAATPAALTSSVAAATPGQARSRAAAVADSIAAAQRREEAAANPVGAGSAYHVSPSSGSNDGLVASSRSTANTGSDRRTRRRVSASSGARDRRG